MSDLKHHHIKFKQGPQGGPAEWEEMLKKVNGLVSVTIDAEKGDVYVEYDIHKCCEEAIEHWMVESGFVLDDSMIERLKRGWIHYTEENEGDNLDHKPQSCCDADEIEKRRKKLK